MVIETPPAALVLENVSKSFGDLQAVASLSARVPVGSIYETAEAKYCRLACVIPADVTASRPDQTTSGFERMEAGLKQAGMSFADVARTWLYLANILDWYGPFNLARD